MQVFRLAPLLLALSASSESACRGSSGAGTTPPSASSEAPAAITDIKGVDTGALTPREKREYLSYVSELLAPCPNQPVSIAQCVNEARACEPCLPAAKLLLKQVRDGRSRSQAEDAFYARFSADRVKALDLADAPFKGAEDAPVTIVEFADFECPHCRLAARVLEDVLERYPGKVRIAYKFFPLASHPNGELAARAAAAAMKQGKFWEMHALLFEHQDSLEPSSFEKFAKQIGLDVTKWKADFNAKEIADRVSRDRKEGDKLEIAGTPALYVNGRHYDLRKFDLKDDLSEWIDLELKLAQQKAVADSKPEAETGGPTKAAGDKP